MGDRRTTKQEKRGVPSEAAVMSQVMEALGMLGVSVQRQNTGVGRYENRDGTPRHVRFGVRGNADLSGTLDGRRFELEIKRPGKYPTYAQYARMCRVNAEGGIAFWTDNAEVLFQMIPAIRAGYEVYIDRNGSVVLTNDPIDSTDIWR